MEGKRRFEASDASRNRGIAALDTNFRPNQERPPLLLTLVTRALSGAGIAFPDKSYVPPGSCAASTSYTSADVVKKRNTRRLNV